MNDENVIDAEKDVKKIKAEAEGKAKKAESKIRDKADDLIDKV